MDAGLERLDSAWAGASGQPCAQPGGEGPRATGEQPGPAVHQHERLRSGAAHSSSRSRLSLDIARDVAALLQHDGFHANDVLGSSLPQLEFHRVDGDESAIDVQVVHRVRAHLRHKLPEGQEGDAQLEVVRLSSGSSQSRASLTRGGSAGSTLVVETPVAGAPPALPPSLPSGHASRTSSGSASGPGSGSAPFRQLSAVSSHFSLMDGSSDAPAAALQPLAPSREHHHHEQQQQHNKEQQHEHEAALAASLAEEEAAEWRREQRQRGQDEEAQRAAEAAALAPYEIDPRDVLVGERLAVGGFAEVFVGRYQGTLVAVKLLLQVDERGWHKFAEEVAMLARIRHPNVVLFIGCCTAPYLAIVSEFMHRGSLHKLLRQNGNRPLEPKLQRSVAVSVARGMAYLHTRSPPLVHLDLKPANILLDNAGRVKIADFGLSRVRNNTMVTGTGAGTPEWMAPEVLRSEAFDERADVYSYGVVLWEVLTGAQPWEGMHAMQVVGAVGFQFRQLPLPTEGDPMLLGLCARCMAPNPHDRPRFPQIVQELEAHYSRRSSRGTLGSLSAGHIRLKSEAEMAARAGGARELPPPPCPPPSAAAAAAAADAPFSHPPPALKLHGAGPGGGGLVGCGSQADGSASREAPYGGHESSPFAPDAPSLSPFASSTLPAFDGEAGQPAPQQQPQSPQRAAVGPPVLRAGLHPAASMTNESPFAALPAFADSDDEEPAAPALQAIAESSSGGLSSAPTIASSQPLASSSGQLAARLRMCQLSSSEDGSLEDPLQVERCLPPGALARTQTLHQQMQEVAATRPPLYGPAHALARLGRPRSAGQLSPPGGEGVLERTCATAQGEGPASAGVAHAGRATSAATSPSKPGPSAAPVAEGAWASLEGAAL